MKKKVVAKGRINVAIEQHIFPSSWLEFHPAMNWPENFYGVNHRIDMDGTYQLNGQFSFQFIPTIPKSWERIYGN